MANTRLVGKQTGLIVDLIRRIFYSVAKNKTASELLNVHCIGHSLGAHTCGCNSNDEIKYFLLCSLNLLMCLIQKAHMHLWHHRVASIESQVLDIRADFRFERTPNSLSNENMIDCSIKDSIRPVRCSSRPIRWFGWRRATLALWTWYTQTAARWKTTASASGSRAATSTSIRTEAKRRPVVPSQSTKSVSYSRTSSVNILVIYLWQEEDTLSSSSSYLSCKIIFNTSIDYQINGVVKPIVAALYIRCWSLLKHLDWTFHFTFFVNLRLMKDSSRDQ